MSDLKDFIKDIKIQEQQGIDNEDVRYVQKQIWKHRGTENTRDMAIYEKFKQLAEAGKVKNNDRFRMQYIWDLKLDWNILILLGKKNIGKTYQIHQLIKQTIAEGKQVVIVRSTVKALQTALEPFFDEQESIVSVRAGRNNTYDLILKGSDWEDRDDGTKRRVRPIKVGFCCSISSLTAYQGASYEKVKLILWDECIDDGSTMNNRTTSASLRAFERFTSSIVRDKLDVKVILFGNLLEKESGLAGDPVLDHFGINVKCGCKYIEGNNESEATVLYINTKSMFKGIDVQGVIGGVQSLTSQNLLNNSLTPKGLKIVSHAHHLECTPYRVLLFTYDTNLVSIHVNITPWTNTERYYTVYITTFRVSEVFSVAYTYESSLYNNFSHAVTLVDMDTWVDLLQELEDLSAAGRILYVGESTSLNMNKYMKHFALMIESHKRENIWTTKSKWD